VVPIENKKVWERPEETRWDRTHDPVKGGRDACFKGLKECAINKKKKRVAVRRMQDNRTKKTGKKHAPIMENCYVGRGGEGGHPPILKKSTNSPALQTIWGGKKPGYNPEGGKVLIDDHLGGIFGRTKEWGVNLQWPKEKEVKIQACAGGKLGRKTVGPGDTKAVAIWSRKKHTRNHCGKKEVGG